MSKYQNLRAILDRKILGTDCTEEESSEIKSYFRENWHEALTPLFSSLIDNFSQEYGEVQDEFES